MKIITIIIYSIFIKNASRNDALEKLTFEKSISYAKMNPSNTKMNLSKTAS